MDGRPIEKLRNILGHSSVDVTERYAHLAPDIFSPADYDAVTVDFSDPVVLNMQAHRAALDALAAEPASAVRTVGFIDHERTDIMEAARVKGCVDVMAKGQFATALPKLLAALAAT